MEMSRALEQLETMHRAVLGTYKRDGSPQLSPVVCVLAEEGRLLISTRETAMKVRNLRRDPRVVLCVFSDGFYGPWLQVEGRAEIIALPEAMEGLVSYYRSLAGEHPDWDEYRQAMIDEKRVLLRVALEKAGPDRSG